MNTHTESTGAVGMVGKQRELSAWGTGLSHTESKLWVNWTCAPCVYKGQESESRVEGTVMRRPGSGDYSQMTRYLWE